MRLWLLSLLCVSSSQIAIAASPKVGALKVPGGIVQLTGKQLRVGQTRFRARGPADPFVDIRPNGEVAILGTTSSVARGGKHSFIRFDSLDTMLSGGPFKTEKLDLHPALTGKEMAWDFS